MVLRELVVSSQLNLQPESDQAFLRGLGERRFEGGGGKSVSFPLLLSLFVSLFALSARNA